MEQTILALDTLLALLLQWFNFDLWVFSQWWLYAPLLIPFVFYLSFFMLKWYIITLPVWLPIKLILSDNKRKTNEKK